MRRAYGTDTNIGTFASRFKRPAILAASYLKSDRLVSILREAFDETTPLGG
jgi:hypothetical protein